MATKIRATVARYSVDHIEVEVEVQDPTDEAAISEAARKAAYEEEDGFALVSTDWSLESFTVS